MSTARELLEQVDSLMRRNRAAPEARSPLAPEPAPAEQDVPLTRPDALSAPENAVVEKAPVEPPADALTPSLDPTEAAPFERASFGRDTPEDIPLLTDVADWSEPAAAALEETSPAAHDETAAESLPIADALAATPEHDLAAAIEQELTAASKDLALAAPEPVVETAAADEGDKTDFPVLTDEVPFEAAELPVPVREVTDEKIADAPDLQEQAAPVIPAPKPPMQRSAASDVAPAPAIEAPARESPRSVESPLVASASAIASLPPLAADDPRWDEIAEDVRIDVLQRIDLFTDTTLQTRLREQLAPVIDRASAELIDVLNRHVGELVRDYVAEAIEREIEKRRDSR